MTEQFSTSAALEVAVDERSMRDARDRIEDELGDVTVSVDASTSDSLSASASGRASKERAMSRQLLSDQQDTLVAVQEGVDELVPMAEERNDILRRLVESSEEGNFVRARSGGGGGGGVGMALGGLAAGAGLVAALGAGLVDYASNNFEWPSLPEDFWPELPDLEVPEPDWLPLQVPKPGWWERNPGKSPKGEDSPAPSPPPTGIPDGKRDRIPDRTPGGGGAPSPNTPPTPGPNTPNTPPTPVTPNPRNWLPDVSPRDALIGGGLLASGGALASRFTSGLPKPGIAGGGAVFSKGAAPGFVKNSSFNAGGEKIQPFEGKPLAFEALDSLLNGGSMYGGGGGSAPTDEQLSMYGPGADRMTFGPSANYSQDTIDTIRRARNSNSNVYEDDIRRRGRNRAEDARRNRQSNEVNVEFSPQIDASSLRELRRDLERQLDELEKRLERIGGRSNY